MRDFSCWSPAPSNESKLSRLPDTPSFYLPISDGSSAYHHATLPFKCGRWSALLQKPSRLLSIPFSAAHRSVTCPATVFLVHASRCPPRIPYLCYYLYFSSLFIYFIQSQSTSWGLNGPNPIQVPGPLLPMLYCSTRPTMTPSGPFQPPGRGVSRLPFG